LFLSIATYGQDIHPKYPTIGDSFPYYNFTDLVNYKTKSATTKDFRGKWLIVDFWATSCSGCLHSFPKMDSIAKEYRDKIQIIMIGVTKWTAREDVRKSEKLTKDIYGRLEKLHNLNITTSFDSTAKFRFGLYGLPLIYVISPNGEIKAKVVSINRESLNAILAGRTPYMERAYSQFETLENANYDYKLPLLTNGQNANGGIDTSYIFRSILVDYDNSMPRYNAVNLSREFNSSPSLNRITVFNHNFNELLNIAFFGKDAWEIWDEDYEEHWPNPIWENSKGVNEGFLKYTYELEFPKEFGSRDYLMNSMQSDLKKYLAHNIRLEKRKLPVYYLIVSDSLKLKKIKTKDRNASRFAKMTFDGIPFVNYPFRKFYKQLVLNMELKYPVIDSTGFQENITYYFKANMVDPRDIAEKLNDIGLKLIEGKKEMEVIIVGD